MLSLPLADRKCNECSVCCQIMAVPELHAGAGKGNHSLCEHQEVMPHSLASLQGACKVYPERPGTCRDFSCEWLIHPEVIPGDERRRPDKLGLLFTKSTIVETGQDCLVAWEAWIGAAMEREQNYLLDKLARKHMLIVVTTPPHRAAIWWQEKAQVKFPFVEDGWVKEVKADEMERRSDRGAAIRDDYAISTGFETGRGERDQGRAR